MNIIELDYLDKRWTCWIAKRPILYNAHDAAINTGAAIINKRLSISENPLKLLIKYER